MSRFTRSVRVRVRRIRTRLVDRCRIERIGLRIARRIIVQLRGTRTTQLPLFLDLACAEYTAMLAVTRPGERELWSCTGCSCAMPRAFDHLS